MVVAAARTRRGPDERQAEAGTAFANRSIQGGQLNRTWQLDGLGNWDATTANGVEQTRDHKVANRIDAIDGRSADVAFDAAGNMTTVPQSARPGFSPGRFVCKYDAWNRLTGVYLDDGQTPGEIDTTDTPVAVYEYDGLGRRTVKLVLTSDPGESKVWDRTDYYYNGGWQVVEERLATDVADGDKGNVATAGYAQYVWSPRYVDTPIVRFRDMNGDGDFDDTEDETLYYLTDANHNVTALVDTDGKVVERYLYDAYGRRHVVNGDDGVDPDGGDMAEWTLDPDNVSDVSNEILYAGYRLDPETGLHQVRHRYYHADLGRFTSVDPNGYGDGMNLYQYAGSGPVSATDPMGLAAMTISWVPDFPPNPWDVPEPPRLLVRVKPLRRRVVSIRARDREEIDAFKWHNVWVRHRQSLRKLGYSLGEGSGYVPSQGRKHPEHGEYLLVLADIPRAGSLEQAWAESKKRLMAAARIDERVGADPVFGAITSQLNRQAILEIIRWTPCAGTVGFATADIAENGWSLRSGLQLTKGGLEGGAIALAAHGVMNGRPRATVRQEQTSSSGLTLDQKINLRGMNEAVLEPWKAVGGSRMAINTPRFTYRGTMTPPRVVFGRGFRGRGASTDLRQHLMDNADPPSAYVSTTRSFDVASDFGDYVYALRCRNGINVNAVIWRHSPMHEISIPWRVVPSDVLGVTFVNTGGSLSSVSTLNPNYKPR